MSNNIDQENPSANDDNTDASNDRGENDYFRPRLQFVILKPLSYCFKEAIGFDLKASFASRP